MKRLLAAEPVSIYQLCKVFRSGEYGRYHNTEFSLLEWYRPDMTYHKLMDEVADLVRQLLDEERQQIAVEKISYQQAFVNTTGIDPSLADISNLSDYVKSQHQSVQGLNDSDKDQWLDLIMGQFVQPQLGLDKLTFVYDFPASKAALATIRAGTPPIAERFELFLDGIELANGYQELTDPEAVLQRFTKEQEIRNNNKQLPVNFDVSLIAACEQGLPHSSGVAMGIDRLLMAVTKQKSLKNVLAFCQKNA